jgi:hypothetical protein
MQLSDITNQSGLVEKVEFWTRLPYGSSGNQLRTIINLINQSFERIMPILLSYSDNIRWDDPNHTDAPSGTFNITTSQNDYKFTEDDNSLDILNITKVGIKTDSTDTVFTGLERIKADDSRVPTILNPDTSVTGIPSGFLELGGIVYFDVLPNYTLADGGEIIFGREQNYFTVTGTSASVTTEPGIPKPFHELLALYAARDWIAVNRPDDGNTINLIQSKINDIERDLKNFIDAQHPTTVKITTKSIKHR